MCLNFFTLDDSLKYEAHVTEFTLPPKKETGCNSYIWYVHSLRLYQTKQMHAYLAMKQEVIYIFGEECHCVTRSVPDKANTYLGGC